MAKETTRAQALQKVQAFAAFELAQILTAWANRTIDAHPSVTILGPPELMVDENGSAAETPKEFGERMALGIFQLAKEV